MAKCRDLETLQNIYSKEILETYYNTHSYKDMLNHFGLTECEYRKLKELYSIKKDREAAVTTWKITQKKNKKIKYTYPTKEDFIDYYENQAHTREQCAEYFKVDLKVINYIIAYYKIKKSKESYNKTRDKVIDKEASNKQRVATYKNTCLEKYGVDNASKVKEIKQKALQTTRKKYGPDNMNNWKKGQQTLIDKHGSLEAAHEQAHKKAQSTWLEKYGVDNVSDIPGVKEAAKKTKLEKYGDENFNNIEKRKETCLAKYGETNAMKTEATKQKFTETMIAKYGVPYAMQCPELVQRYNDSGIDFARRTEKIKQTCLIKYDVPFFCMTPECRNASTSMSKANTKFSKLLTKNNINYTQEFSLENRSYDFKVGNYLIEINPSITHNSTIPYKNLSKVLDKNYHKEKTELAEKYNFKCIHVWDWDDWNLILEIIDSEKEVCYAKDCIIKNVAIKDAKKFLIKNHIQGTCAKQLVVLGLYKDNRLLQLMSFGKPRYNKKYQWELLRLCSESGIAVVGGAEKLFKYFVKTFKPTSIISYCDLSKFTGSIYVKLGMKKLADGKPSKHWYNLKTGKHITDNLLRQRGYSQLIHGCLASEDSLESKSNEELMKNDKFVAVYDSGQRTFVWEK